MAASPLRGRSSRSAEGRVHRLPLSALRPSPENDQLYKPVDSADPDIRALAESVLKHGIKEPLVITEDGWILSGHRRAVAAHLAGLEEVPCRVEPIRRDADRDRFVTMLREFNRQREKSFDEKLREEVVSADPQEAHQSLIFHRRQKSDMSDFDELTPLALSETKVRRAISPAKVPLLAAIVSVIHDRKAFWPLSDRSIHYALLNKPPLRHASKPDSRYANTLACYKDLTDLLTRARLIGAIPWDGIGDETRPVVLWDVHSDVRSFLRRELDGMLKGYWRDYQRSQPHHIELVAEKLTVRGILQPVAQDYCIPLTVGRGYCSIDPRRNMAARFRLSGRDRLIILFVTDFDPDGETIAESYARSMRDDFGVENITPIKVALTADQVRELHLPPQMKAKPGSARYAAFNRRHGDDVFELEAIPPEELQNILRRAIAALIDVEAFDKELAAEREDAVELDKARQRILKALPDFTGGYEHEHRNVAH